MGGKGGGSPHQSFLSIKSIKEDLIKRNSVNTGMHEDLISSDSDPGYLREGVEESSHESESVQ